LNLRTSGHQRTDSSRCARWAASFHAALGAPVEEHAQARGGGSTPGHLATNGRALDVLRDVAAVRDATALVETRAVLAARTAGASWTEPPVAVQPVVGTSTPLGRTHALEREPRHGRTSGGTFCTVGSGFCAASCGGEDRGAHGRRS
jgi:hypothetical protein